MKKKIVLRMLVPELLNITSQKYESPQLPMGFCMFLRKYLQNTRLVSVTQKSFERIIIFEFDSLKFGSLFLIFELFKPGNMILCKKEDDKLIILNALERQEFKSRKIEAREEYVFPPEQNNPLTVSEEFIKSLNESDVSLGKKLATAFSLGGVYAEEIIARSGLDKKAAEISGKDIHLLAQTIKHFFLEEIRCGEAKGKIYPVEMKSLNFERTFATFNEGLDSIVLDEQPKAKVLEAKKKKSKTESLLGIQEKRIRELEKEIDENQKCGEFIYEHYQEFSRLLETVKELRSKNISYSDIEEMLSKNRHFRKLDKSKKTVIMNWEDNKK